MASMLRSAVLFMLVLVASAESGKLLILTFAHLPTQVARSDTRSTSATMQRLIVDALLSIAYPPYVR